MKTYTCVVVEDSDLSRIVLEKAISNHTQLKLTSSFSDGLEAVKQVNKTNVDIIFLDIDLPGIDGFEFLKKLTIIPQIVLYSADEKNALKGFEYGVTDFLLKPFDNPRFESAIEKVITRIHRKDKNKTGELLTVKSELKEVAIELGEIQWVEALGDYVKVVTSEKNHVILSSLSKFCKRLPQEKFIRVHKSYVINSKMVENYNHKFIEIKGTKLPLSRARSKNLDKLLNFIE